MEKSQPKTKKRQPSRKNIPHPSSCIFCKIIRREAPAYRIYEDEHCLVILDIHPHTEGHCLVVSKRHVPWWHDLNEEETKSLFSAARKIARKMMKVFKPDFVCMYARGRRIPHTHIFLIPTYGGDLLDRFFNTLEKVQESPVQLAQLKRKKSLKEAAKLLAES
jgi:histidine triad (HIT) family protein